MKRVLLVAAAFAAIAVSARADEIELVTGEKLKGTIVSRDAEKVVFDHPALGRITIPAAKVKPEPPPPSPWKFKAELGANGSRGNVENSALHAAVSAVLDDDERRLSAQVVHSQAKTAEVKTQDQTYFELTHDWKIKDSPWSVYATARMDWDSFQDWDRRASVGAGVGYAVSDTKDLKLRLRAGGAMTKEWGGSDPDNTRRRPEATVGADGSWVVNETNSIEGKFTYFRDLRDTSKYRVLGSLAWSVKLAKDSPLSMKLGAEDEYDTHRFAPFKKNDFRYFAALVAEF